MKRRNFIISLICVVVLITGVFFTADALTPIRPDLSVHSSDITVSPHNPDVGRQTIIGVRVHNNGSVPAENFYINVKIAHVGGYYTQNFLIRNLEPNQSVYRSFYFTPRCRGQHRINVVAEFSQGVYELEGGNNYAYRLFMVGHGSLPPFVRSDLSVHTSDFYLNPSSPFVGQQVNIGVRVHNRGRLPVKSFYINVRVAHNGGYHTQNFYIDSVLPGKSVYRSFYFTPTYRGKHRVNAVADPRHSVYELTEGNNYAYCFFTVR